MFFTNPIWLWALGGLSIPVAIHLLSRKEGRVIYLGSLRYLEESNTRQFRALRLNEILLLAIRSLLIIAAVLLLAGLSFHHQDSSNTKWVIVEPGLEPQSTTTWLLDSLQRNGFEKHYLTTGFPVTPDSVQNGNYWSLIESLKEKSLDTVIIFSNSRLQHFAGDRTSLPSHTRWITVPVPPHTATLFSRTLSPDSVVVRDVQTSETEIRAEYHRASTDANAAIALRADTVRVALAFDEEFLHDVNLMQASLEALKAIPGVRLDIQKISPEKISDAKTDWVFLFVQKPGVLDNVNQIILKDDATAPNILQQEKKLPYQQWRITKRLDSDVMLRENFTVQLAAIILTNAVLNDAFKKIDTRAIPENFLATDTTATKKISDREATQSTAPALIVVILCLFLLERLVSYYRNQ